MAVRTIRRYPRTVDTDDYYNDENQGYFNFTSFNGINSNKNYISIDQQSFEDAKNMYVDQNGQLSTRPPVRRINILPSNETVVELIKVNNLVIYHTYDGTNYHIRFQYDGYWFANPDGDDYKVGNKVVVSWFQDKYIVFTVDNFFAFSYNYERAKTQPNNAIDWFIAEDIVYIPVQNVGGNEEASQENNIFTTASITRYIFENGVDVDVTAIVGKNVTVKIDNDSFNIVFRENNDKVFTKPLVSIIANNFQVSKTLGNMLCEDEGGTIYYSYDGTLFEIFHLAVEDGDIGEYCLADDGSSVYQAIDFGPHENAIIYKRTVLNGMSPWSQIIVPIADLNIQMNTAYITNSEDTSFNMCTSFTMWRGRIRTIHAAEDGGVALLYPCEYEAVYYKNYELTYVEDGQIGPNNFTVDRYMLVILNNDEVHYSPLLTLNNIPGSTHSIRYLPAFQAVIMMYSRTVPSGTHIQARLIRLKNDYTVLAEVSAPLRKIEWNDGTVHREDILDMSYYPSYDILPDTVINSQNFDYGAIYNEGIFNLYYAANITNDVLNSIVGTNFQFISGYNESDYNYKFTYSGDITNWDNRNRLVFPWTCSTASSSKVLSEEYNSDYFVIDEKFNYVLTENYFYYKNSAIPLLKRKSEANEDYSILPLYIDSNDGHIVYYSNNTIYSSNYSGQVFVDLSNSGVINYILPEHIETFIGAMSVKVFNVENKLYWTSTEGDVGKLYVKENDVYEFEDYITNIVTFSQTSLGIFLEDNVYEFMYDSTNSIYRVAATKLQLGCKRGSDVLLSYDGSSILLTTIKGLSSLSYQDFVQSTEQIYTYLTENIMDLYDEYSVSPIKLYQYKNWLFMYRQDSNKLYMYDTRNTSWWCWEYEYNVQQIMFDGTNLLIVLNGYLENIAFDIESVYDDETHPFDWYFISQKLHFNAPNYYKHIRQVAVITSQNGNRMRYKLTFKNYRNLNNLVNSDTVEFDIEQLNTLIKRVAFMKTNAFQFKISNDDTNPKPMAFIIPDIAIKYRVTEMIR